jgi:hypothetical protein
VAGSPKNPEKSFEVSKKKNLRGSFDWRLPFLGWHSIRSERSANQVEEDAEERSTNQVEEDAEEGGG